MGHPAGPAAEEDCYVRDADADEAVGTPVEMAPLCVLLARQESSYLTGEVYAATGGHEL